MLKHFCFLNIEEAHQKNMFLEYRKYCSYCLQIQAFEEIYAETNFFVEETFNIRTQVPVVFTNALHEHVFSFANQFTEMCVHNVNRKFAGKVWKFVFFL